MAKATFWVSIIAALLVILPGPLYKYNVIELGTAFSSMQFGVLVGLAAGLLLILQCVFFRKSFNILAIIFALSCIAIAVGGPLNMRSQAAAVPAIHDITTDTLHPPQFLAVLKDRGNASNPPDYAGAEIAAQQQLAYPELRTQMFKVPEAQVRQAVVDVISEFGWQHYSSETSSNVEATHQSFWFGFKDDIVVRVQSQDGVTLVDIRSKSRVGRSDLGANAKRIRKLQQALADKLS